MPGNITYVKYVSVLQEGLLPTFLGGRMIKNESLFMGDRAPYHTAKTHRIGCFKIGLKNCCVQVNPQICDMIEYLWAILKHKF